MLYDESAPSRILSPQHWAKSKHDHHPLRRGSGEETADDATILFWGQRKYRRTVPLDSRLNVPIFTTSPGFSEYAAYCVECETDDNLAMSMVTHIIPQDDDSAQLESTSDDDSLPEASEGAPTAETTEASEGATPTIRETPVTADFANIHLGKFLPCIVEDEEEKFESASAELLHYHHKLGHLSFKRLQQAAALGVIPKHLQHAKVPKCTACLFSKATRKPWRTRAKPTGVEVPPPAAPGAVVSVDQLESSTPGFIGQLKGWLTRQRYTTATVFVDHYSNLGFVYLQKGTGSEETVAAKKAFECFAGQHGVKVKHYHGDNGWFEDKEWTRHLLQEVQTMSFSGVGAHFQNVVAKKRIWDLQDAAQTMLLHAQ